MRAGDPKSSTMMAVRKNLRLMFELSDNEAAEIEQQMRLLCRGVLKTHLESKQVHRDVKVPFAKEPDRHFLSGENDEDAIL